MELEQKYIDQLLELTEELNISTDDFFDIGEGRNVSRQRDDKAVKYISKVKYFIGYIEALKKSET